MNTVKQKNEPDNRYPVRLPVAYEFDDGSLWDEGDVLHLYPDVVEWLNSNNIEGYFRVKPCGPVDEDCLYCDDKWIGYLSDNLWMRKFGDFPEAWEGIPKRSTKPRKQTKKGELNVKS